MAVLTSNAFFLLPPIVLDSGYFMPTRPFFENFGTVLWFAVVGTLWNTTGIGISLFAICQIEAFGVQDINLQENLHFASIISAVEPVAVLTVFEDISNRMLFGLPFGFVAAFTTCFTGKVREIKPLMIFLSSYLAYLIAELFAISSIMAFMKFNNRRIHKILIHDNCSESSIVALYKKLELQNAMEILVKMSGEISAAPSLISLQHVSFLHCNFLSCPPLLRNL
ncbi:hypothetical protein cypCar_00027963 [Cyprinus carpio]|nr:hypothetical protein cypCar_00027963 [Cyprinus carpio]